MGRTPGNPTPAVEPLIAMPRARSFATATLETDTDLASRAARGDTGAFEELYRRHAQAAWRVAQAVARNGEDAADAVSDAFTRVFQALPRGIANDKFNFRAYLMTA